MSNKRTRKIGISNMDKPNVFVDDDKQLYPSSKKLSAGEFPYLKGKTLEVYYFLVNHQIEKFGVREIQRQLNYSSSSVSAYHLNRLYQSKLIEKTDSGLYYLDKDPIKLGKLEDHVKVAGFMIPKILLYIYQAVITIFVSIIFYIIDVDRAIWLTFLISSNLVFVFIIVNDARKIAIKLGVEEN